MHLSAAVNLAQARSEAREFGEERRKEIRKRVKEYREFTYLREYNLHGAYNRYSLQLASLF